MRWRASVVFFLSCTSQGSNLGSAPEQLGHVQQSVSSGSAAEPAPAVQPPSDQATIDELEARIAQTQAAFAETNRPEAQFRRVVRDGRAIVRVSITSQLDKFDVEQQHWEREYKATLLQTIRAVPGYNPKLDSIAIQQIASEQPDLSVGQEYYVIKGAGDSPTWRGLSQFDVLQSSQNGTGNFTYLSSSISKELFDAYVTELGSAL